MENKKFIATLWDISDNPHSARMTEEQVKVLYWLGNIGVFEDAGITWEENEEYPIEDLTI